jgi:hypothetical protein
MTYNELLHQVNFEEIAPYIGKYGSKERIALYKTHYDMLRLLEPREGEDDEKTVTVSNAELDYDFEEPHLDAYPIEGCYWEVALSKEIIVEPDVQATWVRSQHVSFGTPHSMVLRQNSKTNVLRGWSSMRKTCWIQTSLESGPNGFRRK